ncbi:GHKL domain-containing protein [Alloscardovia omnicolens]|uniref:Sensor histidine kinase NatK-like C-terminal domain-containing protein n=1 Tax=Alloscardovia omnicolens TaxID=419015 RepID=A0A2I1M389_9BIFI|nr:GHKL domain-containing protein [Alloscardovia omnicolens]MDK6249506.1 GHKL domain-containing protein [Alloscardovia omnicolens]MDK6251722.1 GHKL domain-containing protein [Alloscardovia omnicolens]MDU6533523.1 GHKL domain-containing protein [Alloscardovia omnicolens]MDU6641093.1 GHKL domain-containing protein [Alloscardovia omnicolens]PKZ14593.1 hypothetical protein CYJ32_06560 [Alloscardovia omnicolens]
MIAMPSNTLGFLLSALRFTFELCAGLALFLPSLRVHSLRRVAAFPLITLTYLLASFIPLSSSNETTPVTGIIAVYLGIVALSWLYVRFVLRVPAMSALIFTTLGYSTQHLGIRIVGIVQNINAIASWLMYACIIALTYAAVYFLLARNITIDEDIVKNNRTWIFICFLVVIFAIAVGPLVERSSTMNLELFSFYDGLTIILAMLIMRLIMSNDSLHTELLHERQLDALRRQQYKLTKDTIESINITAHDFKANLRNFANLTETENTDLAARVREETLNNLERSVTTYKSIYNTGNIALDTVLTQKSLSCSQLSITLLCMADGSALNHMREEDIFTLFMNLLDNAIEAVRDLEPVERRVIDMTVSHDNSHACIHIDNYFDGPLNEQDGQLYTSKTDFKNHGFGMRSIKKICEKYSGTFSASHDDSMFSVDIYI